MANISRFHERRRLISLAAFSPALANAATRILPSSSAQSSERLREAQAREALKSADGTKLVLLGTAAGPLLDTARVGRHQTAVAMLHGGSAYVLDFGLGVTNGFARTGIPFSAIKSLFLTHHHPDHNGEYGPFLLMGWIHGMKQTVRAYGPTPLRQMTQDYLRSQEVTIKFWAEDFHMQPLRRVDVTEFSEPGFVMEDENVKVRSALVNHPPVKPAFGYRFDFKDRSIAFSGDTTPLPAVAHLARGADVLVHECMYLPAVEKLGHLVAKVLPNVSYPTFMRHMRNDHTTVEDAGRIAQEAGVKTLVLYHLAPADVPIPDSVWIDAARKNFRGEVLVGYDLMVV